MRTTNVLKSHNRGLAGSIVACSLLLFLAGCINYEQTTKLNMDGSGTASIHYWAEESVVTFLTDGPLVFDEAKVNQRFSGEGITIQNVTVEMTEEDSTRHVHVELAFDDILELAKTEAFEDVDITWEPNGDMMKFSQVIKSGEDGGSFGMEEFTITYSYEMPGEVVSSNATDHDGQTLTWKHKLSDLSGEGVIMSATVKKSGGIGDYAVTIAIALGVLLLIVIIFIAMRKRKSGDSAVEYSTTAEGPPAVNPAIETPEDLGESSTEGDSAKRDNRE